MIGFLDCASGISGDKFLAALVDAGASRDAVTDAVTAIDSSIRIEFERVVRGGIAALGVRVSATGSPTPRTWADIRELIGAAGLDEPVAALALTTFGLLAEAEAAVHGVAVDDVHFHEVGAIDSIADVVGACAAFADLGLTRLVCGPLALGSGTVETAHGTLPVPAPATALLVEGVPVEAGVPFGEATTPTGAALVRACATAFGPLPAMTPAAVGHGAGTRETPGIPNVARLIVGEPSAGSVDLAREEVVELVTTVDHLSAEHLADAAARLLDAGALDVWQSSAVMKKGRPGTEITVLSSPAEEGRLADLLVGLTGTLGVRARRIFRYVAPREEVVLETTFGPVRFKIAGEGGAQRIRPEYDDVAAIARRTGTPADRIAYALEAEARDQRTR